MAEEREPQTYARARAIFRATGRATGLAALIAAASYAQPLAAPRPVDVFRSLDGAWAGTFVGYSATGDEKYRIHVKQRYHTIDEETQIVSIEDTMPDGKVVTGKGRNTARRLADGTFDLRCIVDKSTGDHVEHRGRIVRGPDGDPQIIWYSQTAERAETFRESVHGSAKHAVYTIDGFGRYGKTWMLMHGRYQHTD